MILLMLPGTTGRTQDFTLVPMERADPAPDTFVAPTLPTPLLPEEMRPHAGYEYAIIRRIVYGDGRLGAFQVASTHPRLNSKLFDAPEKFPALDIRKSKPELREILTALIFNPASAPSDGDTAQPRLLRVTPVVVSAAPGAARPVLVKVRLQINEQGQIAEISHAQVPTPALAGAVANALEQWRFSPARRGGSPAAEAIDLTLHIEHKDAADFKRPQIKTRVAPVYPGGQHLRGLEGEVVVEFSVDTEGRVINPYIVRSNNPGFDAAAIEAIVKWQFHPAMADGRPVVTDKVQQLLSFQIQGGGRQAFSINRPKGQKNLSPELQADVPPKVQSIMPAVFPFDALMAKKRGQIEVVFTVGANGLVTDFTFERADHPEFAEAMKAMLDTMIFVPARKGNRAVPVSLRMKLTFNEHGGDVIIADSAQKILKELRRGKSDFPEPADLDGPLTPVSRRPPEFPSYAEADQGHALIEFFVDESGLAQLPRAVKASAPEFGYAASQAVATWRFMPPLKNGRAVSVRVRVPVSFVIK
jgi:TonB family protein